MSIKAPPPAEISLIHKINECYKNLYLIGKRIPKRERFGLFAKIESNFLNLLETIIVVALENKNNKLQLLDNARINAEVLKHIIRTAYDIGIIESQNYLSLVSQIIEISKMINGWRKYLSTNK